MKTKVCNKCKLVVCYVCGYCKNSLCSECYCLDAIKKEKL